MSAITAELPQRVIQDWRRFANQPAFQSGLDWLRHNAAPRISGTTPVEKFESAIAWHAYQQAITDIEDRLTQAQAPLPTLDEPSIHQPR